jgi:phenylacetate-CoA ligase
MSIQKHAEAIYPSLPISLQNILISGQGWQFKRQRFTGKFSSLLSQAIDRTGWSEDQLNEWQVKAAREFLTHAHDTSPYWREQFTAASFDPTTFRNLDDIRQIPVLEKNELRSRAGEIASTTARNKKLLPAHTSGTTGTPISVAFTEGDMRARMAYLYRMLALFEISPLSRSTRFSGRTLFPDAARTQIFWRFNRPMSQMLMSSYDLHPDNMSAYIEQLLRYKPELIDGYPSSIYVLARSINLCGKSGIIRPRAIMTTAETLEEYQRVEISEAFGGAPVINQYASSEGAPFITQDTNGDLVINTDTGIFEFVRPGTNEPAKLGEIAEMLLTSFTTHAYPLIRYRIGDTVMLPEKPRLSGDWNMPVVERLLGRQEDILFTPERGYVGRLDPVFKKSPSTIIESQIVQTAPMAITLRVVPDLNAGYRPEQLSGVMEELRLRLGQVSITVEEAKSLPRGASGKLRAVIGLPSDESRASQPTIDGQDQ